MHALSENSAALLGHHASTFYQLLNRGSSVRLWSVNERGTINTISGGLEIEVR